MDRKALENLFICISSTFLFRILSAILWPIRSACFKPSMIFESNTVCGLGYTILTTGLLGWFGLKKKINQSSCLAKCIKWFFSFFSKPLWNYITSTQVFSHSPKYLYSNWLPFFCPILAPAPSLTYLQRKHHRIMLSAWVIPVMKVELF